MGRCGERQVGDGLSESLGHVLGSENFLATTRDVLTLGRKDFHAKVVESPEVVATGRDVAHLSEFVESLYECRYADFFRALIGLQVRWRSVWLASVEAARAHTAAAVARARSEAVAARCRLRLRF